MEKQEILQAVEPLLQGKFKPLSIENVNHKPHPYMIGTRHVVWASDNYGGMLTEECIKEGERRRMVKCSHPDCNASYEEHTSNRILFLQLTQNLTQIEANSILKDVVPLLEQHKIDGFTFVETPQKYRFI